MVVSTLRFATDVPTDQISGGFYQLLVESQTDATGEEVERYRRTSWQVLSEEGVQGGSEISIDFDPSYQELFVHAVGIHRDGHLIDKLDPGEFRVLQRESRLDYNLYDGVLTALLFLSDVRVGDVVDYSYTLRGSNPALRGHFADSFPARWQVPVGEIRHRYRFHAGERMFWRSHGADVSPQTTVREGIVAYEWRMLDTPALIPDDALPIWFDAYPWVQLSSFGSWAEVTEWGSALFAHDPPGNLLRVSGLSTHGEIEGRVRAAIRFVQDEVRYLGIELGPSSYQPTPPGEVLRRRFGDCKDKSLLLASMLREMGVSAAPALVHSGSRHMVGAQLPSPHAFNHCIVRLRLGDRTHWVAPTARNQAGSLDDLFVPPFGLALVLDGQPRELVKVEQSPTAWALTDIRKFFQIGAEGTPTTLTIETAHHGRDAEDVRITLLGNSPEELAKRYVNYYANMYPDIAIRREMEVEDDREENVVTTREQYEIPSFWTLDEEREQYLGEFFAQEINDNVMLPAVLQRSMPIGVLHPRHIVYYTQASLPEDWPVEPLDDAVDSPFVRFRRSVRYSQRKLELRYEFETLADSVPVEASGDYMRDIETISNSLGYELYSELPPRSEGSAPVDEAGLSWSNLNWPILLAGLLTAALCLFGAIKTVRYRPSPEPGSSPAIDTSAEPETLPAPPKSPQGLRGWLVVLMIGLLLGPILILFQSRDLLFLFRQDTWSNLTTPGGPAFHPLWAPLLLFELCGNIVIFSSLIVLNVLFFGKRRLFPRAFISVSLMSLFIQVTDLAVAHQIPAAAAELSNADTSGVVRGGLSALLWSLYVLRSRRVKATFIR